MPLEDGLEGEPASLPVLGDDESFFDDERSPEPVVELPLMSSFELEPEVPLGELGELVLLEPVLPLVDGELVLPLVDGEVVLLEPVLPLESVVELEDPVAPVPVVPAPITSSRCTFSVSPEPAKLART